MAWDFSTEPEFQEKLDWVERFCREQVEPLELVFPYAVRARDPKLKALVKELQDQVKEQGLWALFLDEDLGGPGFGQLKLGLLNEILGRYGSAPQIFGGGGGFSESRFAGRPQRGQSHSAGTVASAANAGLVSWLLEQKYDT